VTEVLFPGRPRPMARRERTKMRLSEASLNRGSVNAAACRMTTAGGESWVTRARQQRTGTKSDARDRAGLAHDQPDAAPARRVYRTGILPTVCQGRNVVT
jgi:hypothetical protein